MIRQLKIEGFRGFERFEMSDLGRVNLLVGDNNSGKTSLLEALLIALSADVLDGIWATTARRGERSLYKEGVDGQSEIDVCHLFHGRQIDEGTTFQISLGTEDGDVEYQAAIVSTSADNGRRNESDGGTILSSLELQLSRRSVAAPRETGHAPLSRLNAIPISYVSKYRWQRRSPMPPIYFIGVSSLSASETVTFFEKIVLTEDEEHVLNALRLIEPDIERLATASSARISESAKERGGIFAKLKQSSDKVPLGSMGEGMWRMLALALGLTHVRGGVLLVDEIDSGLHYSALSEMWKMVFSTAKRLNVQVFATTHSRDCYQSLAAIAREGVEQNSEVTIQRIERGKDRAVPYAEGHIVAVAELDIEVR